MNNSYNPPINYAFLEGGIESRLCLLKYEHRKIVKMSAEQFEKLIDDCVAEAYKAERVFSCNREAIDVYVPGK